MISDIEGLGAADIAMLEIIDGKLEWEVDDPSAEKPVSK
jgi:hypothetical protein